MPIYTWRALLCKNDGKMAQQPHLDVNSVSHICCSCRYEYFITKYTLVCYFLINVIFYLVLELSFD